MTNAETTYRHANSPSSLIAAQDSKDTPCPGHRCFEDFTSHQLGLSWPTPPKGATLNQATNTSNAGHPETSGAYHFDSSSSTHVQSPRINASQPMRSTPYRTNHREEEGPIWPFASSRAVHNTGVDSVRKDNKFTNSTLCGIHRIKRQ